MLASCLCPTHGRPPGLAWLLEEAVESFLRQTYPSRELLVLNDCPRQVVRCDAPGVRVFNHPYRCGSLGEKYNTLVQLAEGEILLPWEDDDISLPGRIEQAAEALSRGPNGFGYFRPLRSWFWDGAGPHHTHVHGCTHNASAYRREAWRRAGGYPPLNGSQDQAMDKALAGVVAVAPGLPDDPRVWQYVYRWGVSDSHLSSHQDMDAAWAEAGGRAQAGTFALKPHWRLDYQAAVLQSLGPAAPA